jgi:hypothetical protein
VVNNVAKHKKSIKLIINFPNGRQSKAEIAGDACTKTMLDVAEELLYVLTTGKRSVLSRKTSKLKPQLVSKGNADPIGLHSMVEGNRSDKQT